MDLIVKNMSKSIKGKQILSNINLSLESGKIYGFAGRNGCGKTMLFRALSGLMNIDSGEIKYNGKILHTDMTTLPNLGIILEKAGLYPDLTGYHNLQLLAKLQNKAKEIDIVKSIERVGLDPKDKRSFRKYSLGMKQRIVIAQAIMEKPDIIMLDEPTNALDEHGVEQIRNIIQEEKERGALIVLASHNKEDMKLLADHVYQMENGRIINQSEVE